MENTTKTAAVKATELNIWVLAQISKGRREFPNQIESTSAPHMRRCMKAGLVAVVDRKTLRLTDAGVMALFDRKSSLLANAERAFQAAHRAEMDAVARVTDKTPTAATMHCWTLADRANKARELVTGLYNMQAV